MSSFNNITESLKQIKNQLALNLFGLTLEDAHLQHICIKCKEPISQSNVYTSAGYREYEISGLCENCYDEITKRV